VARTWSAWRARSLASGFRRLSSRPRERSVEVPFIALEDLIVNKRAAARPQDIADADALERIGRRR
jgi:hypothetical protein